MIPSIIETEATAMPKPAAGFEPAPLTTVVAPTPLSVGFHSAPSFDVIELLPEGAQDRLRALRQRSSEAHKLVPEFESIREASMARIDAENALKRFVSHPHDGGFHLPETDSRVVAATKHLEKMTADFERVKALSEVRAAEWTAKAQPLSNVETWLKSGRPPGTLLEAVEVEPPKLNKGESVIDGIERLRRRGRELRADQHRVRSASYPSAHAKTRMREMVEALSMQGAPSVSRLLELDQTIDWPTTTVRSQVYNTEVPSVAFAELPNMLALLAWTLKDILLKKLDAEIDAEADDKAALSHDARQKAEAEVSSDMLDIERHEAALCWRAMDEKLPVEHRTDIDPRALLGIALVTAPRAGVPETSPGHAFDLIQPGRRR